MKYLVTGGAGFIASNLVDELISRGHQVRIIDNLSTGKKENLNPQAEFIQVDIRKLDEIKPHFVGVDGVFHFAALPRVQLSIDDPITSNDININGTLNVLIAARDAKSGKVVYSASSSAYGDNDKMPLTEDMLPNPISPYGLQKYVGEHYARNFFVLYGLPTVSLRYFNVYGPKQALDDEYAVLIPKFIHCIMNDEQPPIFGTGKQSRDFTFIDNVVQANILSATTPGITFEVFNVATGEDQTVLNLVAVLNKIIGKDVKPKLLDVRPGDVFRTCADISKIKKILNYKPAVGFEEGLRRTVEYFKSLLSCKS